MRLGKKASIRSYITQKPEPRVNKAIQLASNLVSKVERMIDLGCGNGGISLLFKENLGAKDVYGVDIDEGAIFVARQRGVKAYLLNLSEDKLPFPDEHFDLAISFEVIEHLVNPDNMLKEANRVLKKRGILLIGTPNLASWVNRIFFLVGYQPYNVEVSTEIIVGVPYKKGVFEKPPGHLRAFTLRALKEILEHYSFHIVKASGAPGVNPKNHIFRLLDRLFSLRCSLSRRLIVLAVKS